MLLLVRPQRLALPTAQRHRGLSPGAGDTGKGGHRAGNSSNGFGARSDRLVTGIGSLRKCLLAYWPHQRPPTPESPCFSTARPRTALKHPC